VLFIVLFVNMTNSPFDHPISHRMVAASGVNLHVAQCGQGDPVLLLHGFPDHWALWEPLMPRLGQIYHLMAPDLRGYNLSDKPPHVRDYAIDSLVQDLRALVLQLGGSCHVVGHDWGGMLAWTLAARYPQDVAKLVILNAPHPCIFAHQLKTNAAQRAASEYVSRLRQPGFHHELAPNNFERLWRLVSGATTAPLTPDVQADCFGAWAQPGALAAMLAWYQALDFDAALAPAGVHSVPHIGEVSGQIEAPTLVVWGELDGSFPVACLDDLPQWVPNLRLHREPTGGHWLVREQPDTIAALLRSFLN
jgi:epoxide hydrolase 4